MKYTLMKCLKQHLVLIVGKTEVKVVWWMNEKEENLSHGIPSRPLFQK
ncbi:MAG TPA: hypothetical protein VNR38_14480 [Ureibacillus sp.]|nr:hypothetical protein [Ureibacillus sp.]